MTLFTGMSSGGATTRDQFAAAAGRVGVADLSRTDWRGKRTVGLHRQPDVVDSSWSDRPASFGIDDEAMLVYPKSSCPLRNHTAAAP